MTVDEIMQRLSRFGHQEKVPKKALEEARRQKAEVAPLLLQNMDNVFAKVQGKDFEEIDWNDPDFEMFMYSCYLLSQFKDQRAFPKLMRFLSLDYNIMNVVFMESSTDQLCQFLFSTFNGETEEAIRLAGDPETNDWLRLELIRFLAALVQNGRMDRDEFRNLLRKWMSELDLEADEEGAVPSALAYAVCWCRYEDLIPDVQRLYEEGNGYIEEHLPAEDFLDCMNGKGTEMYANPARQIKDPAKELRAWGCFAR